MQAKPSVAHACQIVGLSRADNGSGQGEQREMNVEPALEADAQLAETGNPGVDAFDNPTMPPEPLLAFHPTTRNTCCDAALPQILPAASKVVALVRVQFAGAFAWLAWQARYRWDSINGLLEGNRIMPVGPRDCDGQRHTARIYDEVSFRSELASVRRVGASFRAPRGLETLAPSMLARPQSIWSCSRNRRNIARCSLVQTPAACQSRSRRQQVMPLPKPSAWGRSSQGMPVYRTYRMPLSAARSSTVRRLPPLGEGVNCGINGSNAAHNSLLILRLAIAQTIQGPTMLC